MPTRDLTSRIDRFAGLSDRSVPVQLSRIESPDLLNVEFSERTLKKRLGYTRLTTEPLKDSSLRLNGYDSFARIGHDTAYDPNADIGIAFHCTLGSFPPNQKTYLNRGWEDGVTFSNRFFRAYYDPTVNTNLGGWSVDVYDATAATMRTLTVNDGDGGISGFNETRVLVFHKVSAGTTYTFAVYKMDGTLVGSATATVTTFPSNTFDWLVGCNSADGITVPTEGDASYAHGAMAELKVFTGTLSDASLLVTGRELYDDPSATEITPLAGYWRMNDGTGAQLTDRATLANHGITGSAGAEWITGGGVVGSAALRFHGERGHIYVDASSIAGPAFTASTSGFRRWSFSFLFTPRVAQGETTVRNQTLFWSGIGLTNPEPLGVIVNADQLEVKYFDTSLKTIVIAQSLFGVAGQTLRVTITYTHISGSERIQASWTADGVTYYSGPGIGTTVSGDPTTVSNDWTIGRKLSAVTLPFTYHDRSAFCDLDEFVLFRNVQAAFGSGGTFWGSYPNPIVRVDQNAVAATGTAFEVLYWKMFLDDGQGDTPVTGGLLSSSAFLHPSAGTLFSWAEGLVEPASAPKITLLRDFRRIGPKGEFVRTILAVSGTTLYEIDPSTGSASPVVGSLTKGGKWTSAQYADRVYMACSNGQRPVVYDGSSVSAVGIVAPNVKSVSVTAVLGAGTMIPAATYYVYVTYRNSVTGVESNPGPVETITLGGTDTGITQITLPISPDPQVNQRRIWITAPGGPSGSTAYLSGTVDDNVTVTSLTDINSVGAAVSLEYLNNEQAPVGSVVTIWKDRLFVAGNPMFPTRVYYSAPGRLEGFNQSTSYEDADLDAGDPVVALKPLRDTLVAFLRDGRVGITATGATTIPFLLSRLNQDVGAVSHNTVLIFKNRHIFLGERDMWVWDGDNESNLSSPPEFDRPSVKYFIRETLADAYKASNAHIALHRSRDQVWLACTTGGNTCNDTVLVLDITQGVWSKYQMSMDVLSEIEDMNDESFLYGGSHGHVVKLDTGAFDGTVNAESLTLFAGTTASLQVSGSPWTADQWKGLYVFVYDISGDVVERRLVVRNTTDTLYLADALSFTPVQGDKISLGSIPFYADFIFDFGNPMTEKRARWLKFAGEGSTTMRVSVQENQPGRTWSFNPEESYQEWASGEVVQDVFACGLGRSFRVRVGETGYDAATSVAPFPGAGDFVFQLFELQMEAEELSVR